ncbi:MAG: AIDA repeat-containing protein, partial [Lentisphaeria bacterium]|nr:AIDA repeat-containing protein [Lentisphaeria bacterium]
MEYYDLVLSGKKVSQTIYDGDYAFNTTVRNSATLRVRAGGRVEQTTVYASTTVSNAGVADSTFLSGGTMLLLSGGTANGISVLRNAKLTVSSGGSATGVLVSSGCLNAVVTGGDSSTLILGSNEAGSFYLSGGVASNFYINSLGRLNVSSGGTALDTVVRFGGYLAVQQGGSASGVTQSAGGQVHADVCGGADTFVYGSNVSGEFSLSSGVAANFILYDGGGQTVSSGGTALGTLVNGQRAMQFVWSAGVASATSVFRAGFLNVYDGGVARAAWIGSGGQAVLYDGATLAGAVVSGELLVDSGSTGEGESGGKALLDDVVVAAGGKLDFLKAARLGAVVVDGELHVGGGVTVSGATVRSGGSAGISGGFVVTTSAWNVTAEKSGSVEVRSGAALFGAAAGSGGALTVRSGGSAADTTLRAGGTLTLDAGAVTTGRITWDFADTASGTAPVNDLNRVSDAELHLRTAPAGGEYTLAQIGGSEKTAVFCDAEGLYDNAVRAGESFTNAFTSMTYTINAAGTAVAAAEFVLAAAVSAGALDSSAAELNSGDRAAKWDATTEVAAGAVIALAPADLSGNAWLDIAGADLSGTTLYGTAAEFAGTVNLRAGDGAVLGRLAAGADTNGSVGGVKLTVDHAALGVAYAGGFGSVTGATETLVVAGSFAKDFYAGALANYAKTRTATSVGDVTLTVESGTFAGNIYGASAVKMGAETAAAHTAGNINVTLAGGEAENSAFCLFGGGYATGNSATTAEVYAAGDVDITVTGGEWGTAHGGRGIFGGVFASQVRARTGDVEITVSGGVMGNVYGGGWAQK